MKCWPVVQIVDDVFLTWVFWRAGFSKDLRRMLLRYARVAQQEATLLFHMELAGKFEEPFEVYWNEAPCYWNGRVQGKSQYSTQNHPSIFGRTLRETTKNRAGYDWEDVHLHWKQAIQRYVVQSGHGRCTKGWCETDMYGNVRYKPGHAHAVGVQDGRKACKCYYILNNDNIRKKNRLQGCLVGKDVILAEMSHQYGETNYIMWSARNPLVFHMYSHVLDQNFQYL